MLSQIRQISDGNHNTVFVKNKEQKFNLDKEIHDLECWKQSRNHVYRKEERELRSHLAKLRHQQEYLHHLDEARATHHPTSGSSHDAIAHDSNPSESRAGGRAGSNNHLNISSTSTHDSARIPPPNTPNMTLPPVFDHKALHRTEAHINICVVCQLPRRSSLRHGHHSSNEDVCCCDHEGMMEDHRGKARRLTTATATAEEHVTGSHHPPPVQIGQRRHSLMMARLNDERYEHKPHPPGRSLGGLNSKDNHHHYAHTDDHVHSHRGHGHAHGHVHEHTHDHTHGHAHGHHNPDPLHTMHHGHVQDHHHRLPHDHHGHHHVIAHDAMHPRGSHAHDLTHARGGHAHTDHHAHHSPTRHHSLTHPLTSHDHVPHSAHHVPGGHHDNNHNGYEARRRDHDLHWDRHQVHKLRGMITDPHYKEQLEVDGGRVYPWSSQYPAPSKQPESLEDMKNCRYLRFSKLNLENMTDNPEQEVEVFERKESPPT